MWVRYGADAHGPEHSIIVACGRSNSSLSAVSLKVLARWPIWPFVGHMTTRLATVGKGVLTYVRHTIWGEKPPYEYQPTLQYTGY